VPSNKRALDRLFKMMSNWLAKAQPQSADEILCPLCMSRFTVEAILGELLSIEHIVPSALGGRIKVITCRSCNNVQGSGLEKHLVKAMQVFDSLNGTGPLPAILHNDGGHVAVNFEWNEGGPVDIKVIGKASNPAGVSAVRGIISEGAKLEFTLDYGFIPEPYWRAIFRVGYLAAFAYFQYGYALSDGGEQVRRVLTIDPPPNAAILEAYPSAPLPWPVLVQRVQVSATECYLALFQLRSRATRWLAVLLPGPDGCSWDSLAKFVENPETLLLRVNLGDALPGVDVRFHHEPLRRLRDSSLRA
jgi:hypothetical protein